MGWRDTVITPMYTHFSGEDLKDYPGLLEIYPMSLCLCLPQTHYYCTTDSPV